MEYHVLKGFNEINSIKFEFLKLFNHCFAKEYPLSLWEHFYKDVPGLPYAVAMRNGEKELVGFSALLPQELVDRKTKKIISYGLQVSTMISPDHRSGVFGFSELIDRVKNLAKDAGFYFILGFLNRNTFLLETRVNKFRLLDEARFVRCKQVPDEYLGFLNQEKDKLFFSDKMWNWRLQRFNYQIKYGCVVKNYLGETNLLDWLQIYPNYVYSGVFPF